MEGDGLDDEVKIDSQDEDDAHDMAKTDNTDYACARKGLATARGRILFLMKAIKHLFVSCPPRPVLMTQQIDNLRAWLKIRPTIHKVNTSRSPDWWEVIAQADKTKDEEMDKDYDKKLR